jgi:hypothetical protein
VQVSRKQKPPGFYLLAMGLRRDAENHEQTAEMFHKCRRIIAGLVYVQVTVHRDNLRINNHQDASSSQNFILSRTST